MTTETRVTERDAVYEKLQESYRALMVAREDAMEATEIEESDTTALKDIEAELICSKKIEGPNEATRTACLRTKTVKERMSNEIAKSKARRSKVAIDIAKDKVRMYESMKDILLVGMKV
jgi:hypothetical protein